MELSSRRRRSFATRHATSVDTAPPPVTKRRTRSVARMDVVDNVLLTTANSSPHHPNQQQQQAGGEAQKNAEHPAETTKETSATTEGLEQSQISTAAAQSPGRDDDGGRPTVAATTSDSTAENKHEADDNDDDNDGDNHLVIDATAVEANQETKQAKDDMNGDEETQKTLPPESLKRLEDTATTNGSFDMSVRDIQVKKDGERNLQELSMQVDSECEQLPARSECATSDVEVKSSSSGTGERTAADGTTDTGNNVVALHHSGQKQTDDGSVHTQPDSAAQTEIISDTGSLTAEEKRTTQDGIEVEKEKEEEQDGVDDNEQLAFVTDRKNAEDLNVETSSAGPQHQAPETVAEDLSKPLQLVESNRSVEDLRTKSGVAVCVSGEAVVTPPPGVQLNQHVPSDNNDNAHQTSVSPRRTPLPLSTAPASLIYPGEGPPVPVIAVTCGECRAELHVDRLVEGLGPVSNSIGTSRTSLCVRTLGDSGDSPGVWMTPNQFQRASGRGTARDWKRSMKHHGVSLKSLLSKAVLSFDASAPGCRCNLCTVGTATSKNN